MKRYRPTLESLCQRVCPATSVLSFGASGSLTYDSGSSLTQISSNIFSLTSSEKVILSTSKYATATFLGQVGTVHFNGYHVTLNSPNTYVYNVGGNAYWKGTSGNDLISQVSQSYVTVTGGGSQTHFIGFDQHTIDGGEGQDTYYLYGSKWAERATFITPNTFYVTHRDGYDNFTLVECTILQGRGGADLLYQGAPPTCTAIGFYSEASLQAMTVKQLVELSGPIPVSSQEETSRALRDYVNQSLSIGINSGTWLGYSVKNRFLTSFIYRTEPVICGGAAILYNDLLTLYGVQSRFIYMWLEGLVDSHVSIEVNLSGHWSAYDPTYNFRVRSNDTNSPLGYEEMRISPWHTDHEGNQFRWRMNYITYPYAYSEYLFYIAYVPVPPS